MHKIIAELTKRSVAEIAAAAFAGGVIVGAGGLTLYNRRWARKNVSVFVETEGGEQVDPNQLAFNLMEGYSSGDLVREMEQNAAALAVVDNVTLRLKSRMDHPSVKTDYTNPGPLVIPEEVYNNPPEVDDIPPRIVTSRPVLESISAWEFYEDDGVPYTQVAWTWYMGDEVLADDANEVVTNSAVFVDKLKSLETNFQGIAQTVYLRKINGDPPAQYEIEMVKDRFADDSYDDEMFERITKPPQLEE